MRSAFQDIVYLGDCLELLPALPSASVDLIVSSPPYADSRRNSYGGVPPERYGDWFLPISAQLYRVLKPDGSFILNIKERVVRGERSTYVIELLLAMRRQGWLWTEEYIWHKKNCFPGKWPNRFRDAWEHCYHFTRERRFRMYQDAVMVPVGAWTKQLARQDNEDYLRREANTGSGFGVRLANWRGRDRAYPANVLHLATECSNREHSAAFPLALPAWFIKLFSQERDIVLDPFLGSGTTAVAAKRLRRHYIGMEAKAQYCHYARRRLEAEDCTPTPPESSNELCIVGAHRPQPRRASDLIAKTNAHLVRSI